MITADFRRARLFRTFGRRRATARRQARRGPFTDRRKSMIRTTIRFLAAVAIVAAAACSDSTTSPSSISPLLIPAFQSTPAGYSSTDNSFSAS